MRIGIDGRALTSRMTGTGRYVIELMRGLDATCLEAHFVLYLRKPLPMEPPSDRWTIRLDTSPSRHLPGPAWSRHGLTHLIRQDRLDVFWAAAAIVPARTGIPVVQTVFDLTHEIYPASMPIATLWGHRFWLETSLREASRRVAISKGTASRVMQVYGMTCDEIVQPVLDKVFDAPPPPDPREPPYVLSVATQEPRKNLTSLLLAMNEFNSGNNNPLPLHLVGGAGWGNGVTKAARHLLDAPWCRVLGYVPNEDLPRIYSNARVFVFPSIYEGYGMPVAEARACGTPIVTTDTPELREAADGEAVFVSTSPQAILEGLREALRRPRHAPPAPVSRHQLSLDGARRLAAQLRAAIRH